MTFPSRVFHSRGTSLETAMQAWFEQSPDASARLPRKTARKPTLPDPIRQFFISLHGASKKHDPDADSDYEYESANMSKALAVAFLRAIILNMRCSLEDGWLFVLTNKYLGTTLEIGPTRSPATDSRGLSNGGIVVQDRDGHLQDVPIVSLVAKRRDLGVGVRHPANGPEPHRKDIVAQEFALLYGQACACSTSSSDEVVNGHDGWLVSIHGTRLRLSYAEFTKEYLEAVRGELLPADLHVKVLRTREYHLKHTADLIQALKAVMGLLKFMQDGDYKNEYLEWLGALCNDSWTREC
ncbi:hypothetical protein BO94DRAFT_549748 [Aspergillus sclerotioniger CBS 115572]|uniref:Uncharacterized protein n=1 Tax=Aspergillus sclerotioniger CBS 115572 TaxID=1450535 RepID=A0A317VLE1_9EURO|nr:hypothetical protein BO94DRAFT_549748 [Aspergillus sclerotioniger CBS 115572]PWY73758.1 hypothetical protein BO94DRAFT_549748 [Aspergillus sclerotioniger CBS 115572]